jgi:hypothetical protein
MTVTIILFIAFAYISSQSQNHRVSGLCLAGWLLALQRHVPRESEEGFEYMKEGSRAFYFAVWLYA